MEFAGAGSLRQRLADVPNRTWDERIADARAVIEGLVAIHAANIVHRDVKPENVLVMDDGRLVVSDFGVAVSAGQTTYFSSKVAGTPSYMAPEVIMGDKATPRADVFSLGIVLHEILFGRRPDWQMTPKGRVIKPVVTRKSTAREKAFARVCGECLIEFAPDRLADAASVKKRFEQAVAGRLRPIRGLRQRWPLVVAGVAVAASIGVFTRPRRHDGPTVQERTTPVLSGTAVDLRPVSRSVLASKKFLRCFDLLPDRKSARIVWNRPPEVIDVDLATGTQTTPRLLPQAFQTGCPQLSRDGRRLLYTKDDERNRTQIMLSEHPDGQEAVAVTEGSTPIWLPSGEEFAFSFDNRRAAAFSLPKSRLLFPDSPPFEKLLQQIAVNESGDQIALLFIDSRRKVWVEVYNYPAMTLAQRSQLDQTVGGVQFDSVRKTLQLSLPDPGNMSLAEFKGPGELLRVGSMSGANLLGGFRTELGMALVTWSFSYSIGLLGPDGHERLFAPSVSGRAGISAERDVVFDKRLDDGRFVIALQRWTDHQPRAITSGPTDLYPSFGAQGRNVVFVRVGEQSIVSCDLGAGDVSSCKTIFTDALGPRFTAVSPDGQTVAYQTTHGSASRLRIVTLATGSMRDLGVYRSSCPPTWSSATGMWIHDRSRGEWREIDGQARPTGRNATADPDASAVCDRPPVPIGGAPPEFRARRFENRSTEVRMATNF
jgi:serine/threonine protein kinase